MKRALSILVIAVLATAGTAWTATADDKADPFEGALFKPEEVMRHQAAIGLSKEQRRELIVEITGAQADFLPAQMEMAELAEDLKRQMAEHSIDEQAAMEVATRLLELESGIKRRHLELAIRIKNLLNKSQQARLTELRGES